MVTRKIRLNGDEEAIALLGEQDVHMRQMEREFGVELFIRHDPQAQELTLSVRGTAPRTAKAHRRIEETLERIRQGRATVLPADAPLSAHFGDLGAPALPKDAVFLTAFGKPVRPRSPKQREYVDAIARHPMTLGIGPAGTGKTYLAVAAGLRSLKAHEVSRIVLTRPVVEAGEKLGFLPGDLYEKVNPYLKPLYDAFYAMVGPDRFRMWRDDEIVEIVPLAYMRGRTLENSFIILDEAQNTTPEQIKMFLTRMGTGSRVVITGDPTQIDLPNKAQSGLALAKDILKGVEGIAFVHFSEEDVARHELVKRILHAYDKWEKR